MDEDAFRAFYDRTSGALWGYLSRISGDRQVADDLLQESYYRLLKSAVPFDSETHRRNYLYRIATNLVRDARRGPCPGSDCRDQQAGRDPADQAIGSADAARAARPAPAGAASSSRYIARQMVRGGCLYHQVGAIAGDQRRDAASGRARLS